MYNASIPSGLSMEVQGVILFLEFGLCVGCLFLLIGVLFFGYKIKLFKKKKIEEEEERDLDLTVERNQIRKDENLQKDFMKSLG